VSSFDNHLWAKLIDEHHADQLNSVPPAPRQGRHQPLSQTRRHRGLRSLTALSAMLVLACGGTALAANLASIRIGPFGPDRPSPTPAAIGVLAKAFPLLARAQQPSDEPAGGVIDPYVASQGGTAPNVRRALTTSHGESLYLVPADKASTPDGPRPQICMMSSDNDVQGCYAYPALRPDDLVSVGATVCNVDGLPTNEMEIAGIVPPGVSDLTLHFTDGTSEPVTITNSVFAVYVPRAQPLATSLTWTGPSGPETSSTSVPPDAATTPCG
jgi:hypothetical protein